MKDLRLLSLERPLFGQVARQLAALRNNQLDDCLREQARGGGRLGRICQQRGLLTREQILDILRFKARWVQTAMRGDLAPRPVPNPSFLSLCMPAYNEAANIEDSLDSACAILPYFVEQFEVVVVDDGSHDATVDAVVRYAARDPHVVLVRHEHNRGYGAAVTTCLRAARGNLIAFTDADGQFSPLDLPQLLVQLEGCDAVIGYRYRRADSPVRRLNAWAWNWLIRASLGVWVRDLDCAFKLFRREVVEQLRMTSTGAAINAEILVQCARGGMRLRETPVTHYARHHGAPTGAGLRVIARAFRELPGLLRYRFAARGPEVPAGGPAMSPPLNHNAQDTPLSASSAPFAAACKLED